MFRFISELSFAVRSGQQLLNFRRQLRAVELRFVGDSELLLPENGFRRFARPFGVPIVQQVNVPRRLFPEAEDGSEPSHKLAFAVPIMHHAAIRQEFRCPPDGQFRIGGKDWHPGGIHLDIFTSQTLHDKVDFGGPPKTVPSSGRQQHQQPDLAFVPVELFFKLHHIGRKFAAAGELVRDQPGDSQNHNRDYE